MTAQLLHCRSTDVFGWTETQDLSLPAYAVSSAQLVPPSKGCHVCAGEQTHRFAPTHMVESTMAGRLAPSCECLCTDLRIDAVICIFGHRKLLFGIQQCHSLMTGVFLASELPTSILQPPLHLWPIQHDDRSC